MELALESLEPLEGKAHLSAIRLQSPELELSRHRDGRLNLESLLATSEAGSARPASNTREPGFLLAVDEFEISDGKVGFIDHAVESAFSTSLEAIDLKVGRFTTAPGSKATLRLSARTEAGEAFDANGTVSIDPVKYEGVVSVSQIAPGKYAPYYRKQLLFDVLDGRLDLKTSVRLGMASKEPEVRLSDLSAAVTSLKLKKRDETTNFLEIPLLQIKESSADLAAKEISIGEIASENGKFAPVREKSGELNLQTLIASAPELGKGKYLAEGIATAQQRIWKFLLRKVSLKNYLVSFEDRMISQPVTFLVDLINIEGRNISAEENSKAEVSFSCRVNERGALQMKGNFSITPLFADLKLSLKDLEMPPVQPYLPEDVKLKLTRGRFSADGNLVLGKSGGE